MADIITSLIFWIATHGTTCGALALTFIIGAVFGMYLQFRNEDKQKAAKRWNA